ncbi:DNA repair protein RecN [Ornithinimicrobium sufpigmenti]|uniref:DNA repair protein RecN n=1 Tax=Ornithinimicrobium sufpigmenti TaxID=2508882 RepID=UPI001035A866|nr:MULTISPECIES: DNA repair protein RecN [unclassified Ornithinimicrobium]
MSLRRIRIQELGVIEDAELDLVDGLNVITGETGAGKTMVVSGLGLLLGERADSGLVRSGSRRAVVEGEVEVAPGHPAAQRAEEAGGDVEDGLVLVRTVAAEGRSRASVGGRSAPVSVLAEVGQHLVAVHGQADQWRLRDADQHRILVDAAGGQELREVHARYQEAWERWQQERARLLRLTSSAAQRSVRVSVLRAGLEEIEAVDPQEGEEDELRTESERLSHSEELRHAAQQSHDALAGAELDDPDQPSVAGLLSSALAVLGPAGEHDPELAQLRGRVQELSYLAADLASDLAGYAATIDVDPARLEAVHARRAELTGLLRRYGPGTREVLSFAREAAEELERIDVSDEALTQLQEEVERLRRDTGRLGAELTAARQALAGRIGAAVTEELAHLAMGSATVSVAVEQRVVGSAASDATDPPTTVPLPTGEEVHPAAHGVDTVEIRLAANPGAPARSVTRAASGGELSRVMLALELVCGLGSGGDTVPTYVFDEVDAGVGGAAALDLGARLARLAEHAQVVVVTHLGQVAAYADRHLVVRKSTDGQVTRSGVTVVEGPDREAELARMLGGVAESDAALQHARELLSRRGTMGRP